MSAALTLILASPFVRAETPLGQIDIAAEVRKAEAGTRSERARPSGASDDKPDPAQVRRRTRGLIAAGIAGVAAYGMAEWWGDGFGGGFKVEREGWFGKDTPEGGMDKLGHAYFTYASTRLLTWGLEAMGNERDRALKTSLITVLGTMTAIEIADGYSRRYDFSWEDVTMNILGAASAWLLESNAELDALVDLRIGRAPHGSGGTDGFNLIGDYSSQAYFLVAKASGVQALDRIPVVRYLELTVGYNARGFDEPRTNPERRLFYGVSLNLGKLIEDTLLKNSGPTARTVNRNFFEYVQIPGTQLVAEHRF